MKVYVIPTGTKCNAKCEMCITSYRKSNSWDSINNERLVDRLGIFKNIEQIEITGGGEPLYNDCLNDILKSCLKIAPTKMYTNGAMMERRNFNLSGLDELCLSRNHYDDEKNKQIMGIEYDIFSVISRISKQNIKKIKFSLLLDKEGVNSYEELMNYCDWVDGVIPRKLDIVPSIVVREMAVLDSIKYFKKFMQRYVGIDEIVSDGKNVINMEYSGQSRKIPINFDRQSCSVKRNSVIIRSDGIYSDWNSSFPLSDDTMVLSLAQMISNTSTCLGDSVGAVLEKDGKILGLGSNVSDKCLNERICHQEHYYKINHRCSRSAAYSAYASCDEEASSGPPCIAVHAEANAIRDCCDKSLLSGATLYLVGHKYVCNDCTTLLKNYGVKNAFIVDTGKEVIF